MNKKEIREFRGISDVCIAKITKDDAENYTTEVVQHLAGTAKLSKTTEVSQETKYYDNKAALIVTSEGDDTVTIDISALDLETLALISGRKYDKTTKAIIESEPEIVYFALGYKTQDTAGHSRYVWRYKVQFTIPDEEYNTKSGDASSNGQSIECKCIYPTHEFNYKINEKEVTESVKALVVSDEGTYGNINTFLDTVTTPDTVFPTTA